MDVNETQTVDTAEGFDDLLDNIDENADTPEEPTEEASAIEETPQEESGTPAKATPEAHPGTDTKANQAFAQLRVQNKQYNDTLAALLKVSGMDPNLARNPEQVRKMIDEYDVTQRAQEANIPPEILQKLENLERAQQQASAEKLYNQTVQDLRTLSETFGLSQAELQSFVVQLQEQDINPFASPVDLVREYKIQNLDKLLADARAEGEQTALTQRSKAATHSSRPNPTQSRSAEPKGDKITTTSAFNKLLSEL